MRILSEEKFVAAIKYAVEQDIKAAKNEAAKTRARKIFHNLTDRNLSESWNLYLKVLDSSVRQNTVASLAGGLPLNSIDYFLEFLEAERPVCPECGAHLRIGYLNRDRSDVVEGYKTYWYCERNDIRMCDEDRIPDCDYVGDFTKLIDFELAAEVIGKVVERVKKKGCR